MSHAIPSTRPANGLLREFVAMPFPLIALLLSLALGLAGGMSPAQLFPVIAEGFGASLGEIALILMPSFVLAAAISQIGQTAGAGGIVTAIAPFAGAAMVCPDTAYATLAPVSAGRKLSVLFGVYAGFKLLVPAGPAIVATTLGGLTPKLVAWGAIAFFASWAVGLLYARYHEGTERPGAANPGEGLSMAFVLPLAVLILLIAVGALIKWLSIPVLPLIDFIISPKGALFLAACISLCFLDAVGRAKALDSGVRRTAPLLLTIGAASALGTMLVKIMSFDQFALLLVSTGLVLPALFALTVAFKLAKGSSMATFAGTSGIVAALLPSLGVSPEAATLAMCAGAFVAIAPNDSLYWLVRQDAFAEQEGTKATSILAIGTTLQGLAAFSVIGLAVWSGML